jgi:hypothetical protein
MKSLKSLLIRLGAVTALMLVLATPTHLLGQGAPAGATFKCEDGTYSTAKNSRGACSNHGGVAQALGEPASGPKEAAPASKPAPANKPAATANKNSPSGAPAGATFKCEDGSYSSAKSSQGACSKHGGVAEAINGASAAAPAPKSTPGNPPASATAPAPSANGNRSSGAAENQSATNATALCKDGTYSHSQHRSGTCSKHGGVDKWLKQLPS